MSSELVAPGASAASAQPRRTYVLRGTLLEACTCNILCPCWVGEDPDGGTCDSILAYHFERGTIGDVDVSGLTLVAAAHIPGNILNGNFRTVHLVDDRASHEQLAALSDVFQGRLGGPVADLANLIGDYLGMLQAPIEFALHEGQGSLRIGDRLLSVMEPYRGPDGTVTTLRDSIFSTIPGAPAWISKASQTSVNLPEQGMVWSVRDRNAIQGEFKFES